MSGKTKRHELTIELVPLFDKWRKANAHLFATDAALRWHLRYHRRAYIDDKALIKVGRTLMCDPPKFEATLRRIGQSTAIAASERATA